MSNNRNTKLNPNVEVVLPAGGSNPTVTSGTVSTGNPKQELKNQIATLKAQQKEITRNIKLTEKQLKGLSKPKTTTKKDVQIVKKKNSKTGKK